MIRVCITGGGSKGAFATGFIKAKEELGIHEVERYGASIGGINSILYGLGYDLEAIWRENFKFSNMALKMFWSWLLNRDIYEAISMKHVLEGLIPLEHTFDHLNCRTYISSTDIISGGGFMFGNRLGDSLFKAALATSAYPIMFSPVEYHDMLLVDGGLVNVLPFPDREVLHPTDITIAVILGIVDKNYLSEDYKKLRGIKRKLAEAFAMWDLFVTQEIRKEIKAWDEETMGKLIVIDMEDFAEVFQFDFSKTDELIEFGYNRSKQILEGVDFG